MVKLEEAIKEIESGNVEKGLKLLEKLEKQADDNTKFSLAEVYYELGHIDKAKKVVDELLLVYPGDGELITYAAELLIDLNEEDEAIAILTEVSSTDPAFLQAQLLLADLFQMEGFDEVAEQKLLLASEHAPDEPVIAFGLGEFYLSRGDYQKSIPFLKKVLFHNQKEQFKGDIELKVAEAYSGSGEYEEALKYYEKGLKEKVDIHGLFGYGYTAFLLEQFELAIAQLNKLKELDPHFTSLYPYLAKSYESLDLLEESLKALQEGMSFDEFNESLYVQAGKLCFKMKDPQSGEKYLKQIIQLNPAHFEAVRTLAAYLKHEERYTELLDLINKFKETGEDDPLLTWYLGVVYKEEDEFEKAKECFLEVYQTFEHDPDYLEDYGFFLLENGFRNHAVDIFKKIIQIDESKQSIQDILFEIEDQI